MNEAAIIAAVDRLNEQLQTLPDWVPCLIDGLYPEFDHPDHSPQMYLALVRDEMKTVEEKIRQAEPGQRELLEQLCSVLLQCVVALTEAGVE